MQLTDGTMATMVLAFEYVGIERGRSRAESHALWSKLPKNLQELIATWMEPWTHGKTQGEWVYNVGEGMVDHRHSVLIDYKRKFPSVHSLYHTLQLAEGYLPEGDQRAFLKLLGKKDQHFNTLQELLPLSKLRPGTTARYESFDSNGTLHPKPAPKAADLYLTFPGEVPVLLEVKTRTTDVAFHFQQLANGVSEDQIVTRACHYLLADVVEKLPDSSPNQILQGAWINISVPHPLDQVILSLDKSPPKLHFIIHYYGHGEARVAARSEEVQIQVCKFFGFSTRDEMSSG